MLKAVVGDTGYHCLRVAHTVTDRSGMQITWSCGKTVRF